jgi:hypothetical protein
MPMLAGQLTLFGIMHDIVDVNPYGLQNSHMMPFEKILVTRPYQQTRLRAVECREITPLDTCKFSA